MARTGYTGEDGVEIFSEHKTIQGLWNLFIKKGVAPCGLVARDILRIEAGFPLYGNELTEHLSPLDTNLAWTVKFTKKDFAGKHGLKKPQSSLSNPQTGTGKRHPPQKLSRPDK